MTQRKVLLFNASNMGTFPVYPYAFIQTSAIARQHGIDVVCQDMLGIAHSEWEKTIDMLIAQHDPAMILITLRNTDTHDADSYEQARGGEPSTHLYFPIERTKDLVSTIRAVSDRKVVLGGYGFSVLPQEILTYLRPDMGVVGAPDAFFAQFEAVRAGHLEAIPNLIYFHNDRIVSNPRLFFAPFAATEYTPQVIEEMMAFYRAFPTPGFLGAPVEIMRGCPHACVFCSEPHVKGKQVRYRNLSTVIADIEILLDHGITHVYMISSELNPESNAFVLQLASKITAFNELQGVERKISWFGANYLMKFTADEYQTLNRSGFTGGWWDVTALDDANAQAMRTPYRNESLLSDLQAYTQSEGACRKRQKIPQATQSSQPDGVGESGRTESLVRWTFFLGNPATTIETIRNTLHQANQEGLVQHFDDCHINPCMRVFDYQKLDQEILTHSFSVTPHLERVPYYPLLPSFIYPPALVAEFGGEKEINEMFTHIAETYLSTKYVTTRDWLTFIKSHTTDDAMMSWIAGLASQYAQRLPGDFRSSASDRVTRIWQQIRSERSEAQARYDSESQARQLIEALTAVWLLIFPEGPQTLGLPTNVKELDQIVPYELAVRVFEKWETAEEFVAVLSETGNPGLESLREFRQFCLNVILYRYNIHIRPAYKKLFVHDA